MVKIVRYSEAICQENGKKTNLQCFYGTEEQVRKAAEWIAKEHGCEVKKII